MCWKQTTEPPDQQRKAHQFFLCMRVCGSVTECHVCVGPRYPGAAVVKAWEGSARTQIWAFRKIRKLSLHPIENLYFWGVRNFRINRPNKQTMLLKIHLSTSCLIHPSIHLEWLPCPALDLGVGWPPLPVPSWRLWWLHRKRLGMHQALGQIPSTTLGEVMHAVA